MERFSVIRSCWGRAMVSTAAEPVFSGRQTAEEGRLTTMKSTSSKTTHWKPKLQAISEDCPTSDVDSGGYRQITQTGNKKRAVKVRTKSAPAPAPPKGSWKSSPRYTLPAFSPTPFLF